MQHIRLFLRKHQKKCLSVSVFVLAALCILGLSSQHVFAQTTYVITDGDQITVHTSFETDPATVLGEAGLSLRDADSYITQATEGAQVEITVQRAQNITVRLNGEVLQATSYGDSLETLLTRMGIAAQGNYAVSVPLDTQTYDGMDVSVDSLYERGEAYTTEIAYEVTYCSDPTLPMGEEKILVEGKPGQMLNFDNVIYKNTQEQSRTNLKQTVLEQPVNQLVARGTGTQLGTDSQLPLIGDGIIVLPSGEVLTYTGTKQFLATAYTKTDEGCDETTATGTQVRTGVVAVDPTVVPYGTRMFIVTNDGAYIYGVSTAEDCGGGIKGNRLDLYFHTDAECWQFGVRDCTVYFLGDANWR